MSAFMVAREHIAAIVEVALRGPSDRPARAGDWRSCYAPKWPSDGGGREVLPSAIAHGEDTIGGDELGGALWAENARSVRHRYEDADDGGMVGLEFYAGYEHPFTGAPRPSAVEALKLIHCLGYQSCEHDEWKGSDPQVFLSRLADAVTGELPGYEHAAWEYPPVQGMVVTRPVVIVVRHPDSANEITAFPGSGTPLTIDVDLGSSFDGKPDSDEQHAEWRSSFESELQLLRGHPAYKDLTAILDGVMA